MRSSPKSRWVTEPACIAASPGSTTAMSRSCNTSTASTAASTARRSCRCSTGFACPPSWCCTPSCSSPTRHQREVLEAVVAKADAVVTMTMTGRDRLAAGYDVDIRKVQHHRARRTQHAARRPPGPRPCSAAAGRQSSPGGCLGPGQGHRVGNRGDGATARPRPRPTSWPGRRTRRLCCARARRTASRCRNAHATLGLGATVTFDGRYRDPHALAALVQSADVVLLPYDSVDQVTSGVLIEAVAAGKPVVATGFPHAVELLGAGAGIVVSHRSPDEIAVALRTLITQRRAGRAHGARRRGERAPAAVARRRRAVPRRWRPSSSRPASPRDQRPSGRCRSSTTCCRLTDHRGLFEHARLSLPRREHGYCVDDVARGLVVVCREPSPDSSVRRLERHYLDFVLAGIQPDGTCRNRMDADGAWLDEPGVGDWWGRALWGLGVAAAHATLRHVRAPALAGFQIAAAAAVDHTRRAMAYAALGAAEVLRVQPADAAGARRVGRRGHLHRPGRARSRLAVAGAAPALRQRHRRRGPHRRRCSARGRPDARARAGAARVPAADRDASTATCRSRRSAVAVAARSARCSTSNRSRSLRSLMPAPAPTGRPATRAGWWACALRGTGSSATTTQQRRCSTPRPEPATTGWRPAGPNRNQGAESTLAMLSTAQHARWLSELR